MSCSIARQDAAHRYVAGTLSEAEASDFESHLLACAECRDAVRDGVAIRRAFTNGAPASRTRSFAARPSVWLGALGVAAALVFAIARRSPPDDPAAAFHPPTFTGVVVRGGNPDSARALVDSGMAAYVRGDFRGAARALSRGAVVDSSPGVAFYLAASLLADGRAVEAVAAGRRAYRPAANPFAADARVVVAKAWIHLTQRDSALAELQHARRAGDVALRDSVARRTVK